MTSTPVKEVGSAFMDLTTAQNSKNPSGNGDFLKVWSNQMSKGAQGNTAWGSSSQGSIGQASLVSSSPKKNAEISKADNRVQKEDSAATQGGKETAKSVNGKEESDKAVSQPDESEALSSEELEDAMEVLGTAALDLMQQIADVFGISMEELQAAMEDLGMDLADVLDASELSALLLNLGGAGDSYALVTDETLYGRYQELMGKLDDVLQESADALGMNPDEVALLLEKASGKEEVVPNRMEELSRKTTDADVSELVDSGAAIEETYEAVENVYGQQDGQANAQDGQENAEGGSQSQAGQIHREVRHENDKTDREQPVGLFSQQLNADQFEPEVQQAQTPQSTGWSADTKNIMDQIMDYMKLQLNADTTSLEMQLHPASLGALQIQLASKAGVITANFIAQNEAVKTALESQISQLKESFEEQGVKVEAIEVTVQTHEFERNLEQGRERNQQEPEKKNRVRRINLDNPMSMEDLDEEETLAADMLAASGSTVEFTA